jgi:hypothetical protein
MAVPRPILFALVGLVLVVGAFLATRSSQEASEPEPAPAAEQATPEKGSAEKVAVAEPATPKPKPKPRPQARKLAPGMPASLARALAQHKTVVIFFRQARGADDAAVATAVSGLSRFGGRVVVFRTPIKQLSRYKAIVDGVGVSRAPAVVIVDRKGQASLVEGYVDPETLAQEVADTR